MSDHHEPHTAEERDYESDPITSIAESLRDWKFCFEQIGSGIEFQITGGPEEYRVRYDWDAANDLLTFVCGFTLELVESRLDELGRAILLANKELAIGHFDYMSDEAQITYWSALFLEEGQVSRRQVDMLLQAGLNAFESYQSGFRMVARGGSAQESIAALALLQDVAGHG